MTCFQAFPTAARPSWNESLAAFLVLSTLQLRRAAGGRGIVAAGRRSGADVNALAGNGKSASRLVAETATVEDATRREAIRYLESVGGWFVPDIDGWWRRFWVRRGVWLSP